MTDSLVPRKLSDLDALPERLFLKNINSGRVVQWTALLAVKPDFVNCREDGETIRDVPGDHPWIRMATSNLYDRMHEAGATPDTLFQMGAQLKSDMEAKTRLTDEREERARITDGVHNCSQSTLNCEQTVHNKAENTTKNPKTLLIILLITIALMLTVSLFV